MGTDAPNVSREANQRLSVVIPTYNHGHFITQALDSLFAQTRLPDRIIVLDDASTDSTGDVMEGYKGRCPQVEYIRNPKNLGIIANLNAGLDLVDDEFVLFLAADDFLAPSAFEKCIAVMAEHPEAAVCGVLTRLVDEAGQQLPQPRDADFGTLPRYLPPGECLDRLYRNGSLFSGGGATFRTRPLKDAGGFSPDLRAFCDGFRVQDLALRHGVCIVPEPLFVWRVRQSGYAATNRVDPRQSLAILDAAMMRLSERSSAFPPRYGARLEKRLRFAAASAAVLAKEGDFRSLREALGGRGTLAADLIAGLRRIAGPQAALVALAILLRSYDIVPGLLRRVSFLQDFR